MSSRLRQMVRAMVAFAILATTCLTAIPASASPTPPEPWTTIPDIAAPSRVTLSGTEWKAAGYVTKARNQAVTAGGSTMNYRTMKTIFGTKNARLVDWRRQAAAGFRQAGGKIIHISKAESKAVNAKRKRLYGRTSPVAEPARDMRVDGSGCQGLSGTVVVSSLESHKYFNSCETIDLEYYWGGCVAGMAAAGRFTKKDPRIDLPRYFIGLFCAYEGAKIKRAADKSQIGAIFIRTYRQEAYQPYPAGVRYSIQSTLIPQ